MFLWLNLMAANGDIAANGETTDWDLVLQAGESFPVDLERQRPYTQEPCEHCDGVSRCITRGANAHARWLRCKECARTIFSRPRRVVQEMWAYLIVTLWWHGDGVGARLLSRIPCTTRTPALADIRSYDYRCPRGEAVRGRQHWPQHNGLLRVAEAELGCLARWV